MRSKEKNRANVNRWIINNPERWNKIQRINSVKRRRKIRAEIFKLLGGKCSNPNCPVPPEKMDIRCLQIDHVNGGGHKQKLKNSGEQYYKKILKEIKVGSKDYQLLCVYCNWIKRYENNE